MYPKFLDLADHFGKNGQSYFCFVLGLWGTMKTRSHTGWGRFFLPYLPQIIIKVNQPYRYEWKDISSSISCNGLCNFHSNPNTNGTARYPVPQKLKPALFW